jgi:hypothetical protein
MHDKGALEYDRSSQGAKVTQEQLNNSVHHYQDRPILYVFQRVLAVLAAGFGFWALFGWVAGYPLLTTVADCRKPIAPSSALLFLLCGTAIFFCDRMRQSARLHRIGLAFGWSVTAISLALLVLFLLGAHPFVEHPGMQLDEALNGGTIGHMSPVTAFCFGLTGLAFLALLSSVSGRHWRPVAALGLASLITWSGIVLVLAYLIEAPVLYGIAIIPPSLTTSLAFLMLGASLMVSSGLILWPRSVLTDSAAKRSMNILIVTFVLLATSIITIGYGHILQFERNYRAEAENGLSAIAAMKVKELACWRQERLGDASIFLKNDGFTALVSRYFDGPEDPNTQERLQTWMSKVSLQSECDRVILLDAHGMNRMSAPPKMSLSMF